MDLHDGIIEDYLLTTLENGENEESEVSDFNIHSDAVDDFFSLFTNNPKESNSFLEIDSVATNSFQDANNLDLDLNFLSHKINYYYSYFSNFYLSLYSLNSSESFLTPSMVIFQFFFIFLLVLAFLMTYFNYYGSVSSEENLIDHDYLIFNITIEAEEEIGSM